MSKKLRVQYPWADTPIGGSFFVPTLKPPDTVREGLKASIGTAAVPEKPLIGMQGGRFGVLFKRKK